MFHVQIGPKTYWIGNTIKGSAQRKLRWAKKISTIRYWLSDRGTRHMYFVCYSNPSS
jgi:hypothetical protein